MGAGMLLLVIMGFLPEPGDGGMFHMDPRIPLMLCGLTLLGLGGWGLARVIAVKNGWYQ